MLLGKVPVAPPSLFLPLFIFSPFFSLFFPFFLFFLFSPFFILYFFLKMYFFPRLNVYSNKNWKFATWPKITFFKMRFSNIRNFLCYGRIYIGCNFDVLRFFYFFFRFLFFFYYYFFLDSQKIMCVSREREKSTDLKRSDVCQRDDGQYKKQCMRAHRNAS